jgi:hypothetical protein
MNLVALGMDGVLRIGSEKSVSDPLACLTFGLTLDPDSCLRDFFKMMQHYPLLLRLSTFLPDLLAQYHACPDHGCCCNDFDYLEFTKTIEMVGFPGEPRLEIYAAVQGKKDGRPAGIRSYSLSMLLDLKIRLGRLKHVVFGDKVDTFEFDTVISLFEFIDGIVWELSFHVLPKECQLRR